MYADWHEHSTTGQYKIAVNYETRNDTRARNVDL